MNRKSLIYMDFTSLTEQYWDMIRKYGAENSTELLAFLDTLPNESIAFNLNSDEFNRALATQLALAQGGISDPIQLTQKLSTAELRAGAGPNAQEGEFAKLLSESATASLKEITGGDPNFATDAAGNLTVEYRTIV